MDQFCGSILSQNDPVELNNNFFKIGHSNNYHVPLGPFPELRLKKSLEQVQSYEDVPFFGCKLGPKKIVGTTMYNVCGGVHHVCGAVV